MPQYLSIGDFKDVATRLAQRGSFGFFTKVFASESVRTKQTFDHSYSISIWNMVPKVRRRLNQKATGNPDMNYEQRVITKFLQGREGLRLLSIGCGSASHELFFAEHGPFALVHGIDLAPAMVRAAEQQASERKLENTRFEVKDFLKEEFSERYDVVLFHQSLHHFEDFDFIVGDFLPEVMSANGLLVLNEYVGPTRLQWTSKQLKSVNQALRQLPKEYRRIFKTNFIKSKVYRPGWWRMKLSDPSESINTDQLLPKVHQYCEVLEEKALGGNLLHLLLKDIAHNFCNERPESQRYLDSLFKEEDEFLQRHKSDFAYGVYRLKEHGGSKS